MQPNATRHMTFIEKWQDHLILLAIFPVCSVAGLAALLRSDRSITKRAVWSAVLNSGLIGVVVAALLIHQYEMSPMVIGASILAGLGGNVVWEAILEMGLSWLRMKAGQNGRWRSVEDKTE